MLIKRALGLWGVLSLCLLAGCDRPEQTDQADIMYDAIVKQEQAFMTAFEQQNARQIAQLYSEDGQLLPLYRPFIRSHTEIERFWRGLMRLGIRSVKLETLEIEGQGDHAHEVGRYTIHTSDDEMIDYGKYIVIWKKTDQAWQLHRHIWTTSRIKAHESQI